MSINTAKTKQSIRKANKKTIVSHVDAALGEKFVRLTKEAGMTASQCVREMIESFCHG